MPKLSRPFEGGRSTILGGHYRSVPQDIALLVACGAEETIAIHGDSTAIASRSGLAKAFNLVPSWDWKRWWVIAADDLGRRPFNDGVGGQDIHTMRTKMEADHAHRNITTILYDRRNDDETAEAYLEEVAAAVATLQTEHFLITLHRWMAEAARLVNNTSSPFIQGPHCAC